MSDILIVDDERDIRELIGDILRDEGFTARLAGNSDECMTEINNEPPSLIILDIWLKDSRMDGIDILKAVKRDNPDIPVVIISGHGNIEIAVAAIKQGAYDFIEKPFNIDQLMVVITRAMETSRLRRENTALRRQDHAPSEIIGNSASFKALKAQLDKVTTSNGRVMLTGPAGSGKEVAARYIHAHSNRSSGPFVCVNSASVEPDRMEEVLFGRETPERGVESGLLEEAHQVISSSNKDLEMEVENGQFRQELYHRLNVVPIAVPALEERREDIPELARYFLTQLNADQGLPLRELSSEADAMLQTMAWPGNVRQLKNVIERVLILGSDKGPIAASELPQVEDSKEEEGRVVLSAGLATLPLREARELFEREYLLTQINRFGGNISRTASFVGMERSALHRKLKSLNVVTSNKAGSRVAHVEADADAESV